MTEIWTAFDLQMKIDLGGKLGVPQEIACTKAAQGLTQSCGQGAK